MFGKIKESVKKRAHSKIRHRKIMKLWGILIVLTGLIVISGINTPYIYPLSDEIQLNYPTAFSRHGDYRALVDSQGKRMLIYCENTGVVAVVDTNASGSPLDRINGLVVHNDTIYAFGCRQYHKGIYLSSEAVVTYNVKGEYQKTLYEKTYDEEDFVCDTSVKKISIKDDAVFMTTAEGKKVSVYNLSESKNPMSTLEFPEEVVGCCYNDIDHSMGVISQYAHCYFGNIYTGAIEQMTFIEMAQRIEALYGFDFGFSDFDNISDYKSYPEVVFDLGGHAQFVFFVNPKTGKSVVFSQDGKSVDVTDFLPCSTRLIAKNIAYWVSLIFLIVTFIDFIIWLAVKKLSPKGVSVLIVIGCILFTSVFYTWHDAQKTASSYNQKLRTEARQFAAIISRNWGDDMAEVGEQGIADFCSNPENQKMLNDSVDLLRELSEIDGTEQPTMAQIYLIDKDDDLHAFIGAGGLIAGEKVAITWDIVDKIKNINEDEALTLTDARESFAYGIEPIRDSNGEEIGAVVVAGYRGNIIHTCVQSALMLFVSLVTILIGIYLFINTFQTFAGDIKSMRRRDKADRSGRAADICGLLMFIVAIAVYIDAAIVVYIAKSMCADISPSFQAMLIALSLSANAAGALGGSVLFAPILHKFGKRTVAVAGTIAAIAGLLLSAFSVQTSNIYLYIAGKFIVGFFNNGILYLFAGTLPYDAHDERTRKKAAQSVLQASNGGAVLAGLAGGYIAEYISYSAVYLLPVVLTAAGGLIAAAVFTNKQDKDNSEAAAQETDSVSLADHWKVYLKKPMLMYGLFYTIPWIITGGYSSYLFPLYTASAGISALLVSNIVVFAKALVYVAGGVIDSIAEKMRPGAALVLPMFIICAGLVCFYLSPNIYWAVAMMFVFRLMWRMPKIGQKMYINDAACTYNLNPSIVISNHSSVESMFKVIRSPILAAFVSLGVNMACAAMGIVCAALLSIFALYNKRREQA